MQTPEEILKIITEDIAEAEKWADTLDDETEKSYYSGKYTGFTLALELFKPLLDTATTNQLLLDEVNRLNGENKRLQTIIEKYETI